MVKWTDGRIDEWWGAGVVNCLERDADLHMAQLMPLPLTVSCYSKIQIGFFFLVPDHLDKGPLNGCVCVLTMVKISASDKTRTETLQELGLGYTSCRSLYVPFYIVYNGADLLLGNPTSGQACSLRVKWS